LGRCGALTVPPEYPIDPTRDITYRAPHGGIVRIALGIGEILPHPFEAATLHTPPKQ